MPTRSLNHTKGCPNLRGALQDDWEVVDQLMEHIDVRRPVIQDVTDASAAITSLNAGAGSLPTEIHYGEIAYQGADLGFLARVGPVNYTIFDVPGINFGEQLSDAAATFILDAGHTPSDYPGDGLIPVADQQFRGLVSHHTSFVTSIHGGAAVLHTEEPAQRAHIRSVLQDMAPTWLPAPAP